MIMPPVPPTFILAGQDLPVGSYHVKTFTGGAYTVARLVGVVFWFPLASRENLVWKTWPSFVDATNWMEEQGSALCDYLFWGR